MDCWVFVKFKMAIWYLSLISCSHVRGYRCGGKVELIGRKKKNIYIYEEGDKVIKRESKGSCDVALVAMDAPICVCALQGKGKILRRLGICMFVEEYRHGKWCAKYMYIYIKN